MQYNFANIYRSGQPLRDRSDSRYIEKSHPVTQPKAAKTCCKADQNMLCALFLHSRAVLVQLLRALHSPFGQLLQQTGGTFLTARCNAVFNGGLDAVHVLPLEPQVQLPGVLVLGNGKVHRVFLELPPDIGQRFVVQFHRSESLRLPVQ